MARQVGVIDECPREDEVEDLRMELIDGRLCVFVGLAEVGPGDLASFRRGPLACSFLDPGLSVPVAVWTFIFPPPLRWMEVSFDLRSVPPEEAARMPGMAALGREGIFFLLYRGDLLVETCEVRPSRSALRHFGTTLRRQRESGYEHQDFVRCLRGLESFTVEEIFALGRRGGKKGGGNIADVAPEQRGWESVHRFLERPFSSGGSRQ